jgi:hypothetical protein
MRIFSLLALCFIAATTLAQSAPEDASHRLPVKHVVLYKNGVGYFEHDGRVRGNQQVTIDFTTAQLNDVLKSLTAIDLGNGRITDVSYNSTAPLNQRLNSLRLSLGEKTTTAAFLDALRGARIEVHSGPMTATGRLLSVESRDVIADDTPEGGAAKTRPVREDRISLMTDAGELRTFTLTPATSVRIVEQDLNQEVSRYLSLVASSRAEDVRRMTISTAGDGERNLRVSYISEVPVWKSTYRIVLPNHNDAKPLLQGWAIVDNTVGEDWENVELSLVAGAPQSFVQQISQPYYARRPVVGLPELAMLSPQTHEETLETFDKLKSPAPPPPAASPLVLGGPVKNGQYEFRGQAGKNEFRGTVGGFGSGSGAGVGSGTESVAVEAEATDVALERQQITAQTQDIGDLFEYKIRQPVTIHKNQSALVPILQARVDAEKVSLWNPESPRVLRALWLNNTSGLTLDRGTFNIQEDSTFAGEGLLDPIRPGEKRLISYAADSAIQVESKQNSDSDHVRRIVISRGVMVQTEEQREHRVYTIRNSDKTARTVVIEHPLRAGWKLTSDMKPEETTASHYRFRLNVEPEKTGALTVDELHSYSGRYMVSDLTAEQITGFLRTGRINAEVETALRPILNQRKEVSGFESQIISQRGKLSSIFDDQKRLRENLSALKGNTAERSLIQRYTGELNRQEDELASLRRTLADLQTKRDEAKNKLDAMLDKLALDTKL